MSIKNIKASFILEEKVIAPSKNCIFRFQISDLDLFQNQKLSTYDTTDKFILDISTIDHNNVAKLVHG